MMVALARTLLVALWQLATRGLVPEGAILEGRNGNKEFPLSTGRGCGGKRDRPTALGMGVPALAP